MAYKFSYIPSTQDGFSLQEGDAALIAIRTAEARHDAVLMHQVLGADFDLDEFVNYVQHEECMIGTETYMSEFIETMDSLEK